jgi:predicted deacylase
MMKNKPFMMAGHSISPGEHKILELPIAGLYTQTSIQIPIHVIHGKKKGPCIFITAALHGDEVNGVEIIRRLLRSPALKNINGTLIAVPVANMQGFITLSRYLPDGRDLNRSFPGSKSGSMAARLANLYMEEIIRHCTHGIDLHTGNIHSENLPHIRTNLDVYGTLKMAKAFNVPVIFDAKIRDGSIREAATELDIPVIIYEGGEGLRFNELAIRLGVRGILNVLNAFKMINPQKLFRQKRFHTRVIHSSTWVRSPESGIFYQLRLLGADVQEGEKLGIIADPFSKKETKVFSPAEGIIIGRNTLPLVNEGDALFHIAKLKDGEEVTSQINELHNYYLENPFD